MKVVIDYLRELQNGADPDTSEYGICTNLSDKEFNCIHGDTVSFVAMYAKSWDRYSGISSYPISCGVETPSDQYWGTFDLWVGEYGDLRRDLCGHIADRLEEELNSK